MDGEKEGTPIQWVNMDDSVHYGLGPWVCAHGVSAACRAAGSAWSLARAM